MEKEVKKKRTTKKAKEQETKVAEAPVVLDDEKTETFAQKAWAQYQEEQAKETPKKPRKPRAKKTVEKPVDVVEEATETAAESKEEKAENKPKKTRAKKAKETQKKAVEVVYSEPADYFPEKMHELFDKEVKTEEKYEMTRAEKKDAVRAIVKELLSQKKMRKNALIDEAAKAYVERHPSQETVNVNDVKGRVGSVITLMEHAKEIFVWQGEMTLEEPPKMYLTESVKEEKTEEPVPAPTETEHLLVPVPEAKLAPVFDLSALLGDKKAEKAKKAEEKKDEDKKRAKGQENPVEEKPAKERTEKKSAKKTVEKPVREAATKGKGQDKLKEKFLKKIRSHGGAYLEYYAVYLLQRYAQSNGRRLEGLRVSGGENDGGIDGELVLTDRMGFKETLYIQAKNWEPTDEKWMVGETLLQQFIGAVTYRLRKEGKGNGRGVYVTTSRFSDGAKKMLDEMSDQFVGYDGDELFDLAKECHFGLIEKDGEWTLDENLLAGEKAFFNM